MAALALQNNIGGNSGAPCTTGANCFNPPDRSTDRSPLTRATISGFAALASFATEARAAQRGSVITLFGTGEGQTNPPRPDGRIILSDLRRPLLPVVARIGGRLTEVRYAGSAPTLVSRAFQANVQIPADIEPGTVTIELELGGVRSQAGVTIVVR